MELFSVLESHVGLLLERLKELSLYNSKLTSANQVLKLENEELSQKVFQLEERVVGLGNELESFKNSLLQESSQIEELHQEKALAKLLIEDLIKNIETSVVTEQQP